MGQVTNTVYVRMFSSQEPPRRSPRTPAEGVLQQDCFSFTLHMLPLLLIAGGASSREVGAAATKATEAIRAKTVVNCILIDCGLLGWVVGETSVNSWIIVVFADVLMEMLGCEVAHDRTYRQNAVRLLASYPNCVVKAPEMIDNAVELFQRNDSLREMKHRRIASIAFLFVLILESLISQIHCGSTPIPWSKDSEMPRRPAGRFPNSHAARNFLKLLPQCGGGSGCGDGGIEMRYSGLTATCSYSPL